MSNHLPPHDFCVFILTHGRPDNQITHQVLNESGYTGALYFIVDNEDKMLPRYRELYGDQVIVFDKAVIAQQFDEMDCFDLPRQSVVYARNACFEIASRLGYTYFLELDDDYKEFQYRFGVKYQYQTVQFAKDLNHLFAIILKFYQSIPAKTIAMGQTGDLFGIASSTSEDNLQLKRKAMNTFFCSTERPFQFIGRINEDVNTYVALGMRGELLFTFFNVCINQQRTQAQAGGMTDLYLQSGTYIKSFYTVMCNPSCVMISVLHAQHSRLHHRIKWANAVPVIMSEQHRKP